MNYLSKMLWPVFIFSAAMLGNVFLPILNSLDGADSFYKSIRLGSVLMICAGINYFLLDCFLLDYLTLVPGQIHAMA